jgi:hypothetical protein
VWQHCDGVHSVRDLALLAQDQLGASPSTELVEMTLSTLEKAHLLSQPVPLRHRLNRREVLKSLGVAAAVLPAITTIIAPEPALAQSVNTDKRDKKAKKDKKDKKRIKR